jgi:hypothetical protein
VIYATKIEKSCIYLNCMKMKTRDEELDGINSFIKSERKRKEKKIVRMKIL